MTTLCTEYLGLYAPCSFLPTRRLFGLWGGGGYEIRLPTLGRDCLEMSMFFLIWENYIYVRPLGLSHCTYRSKDLRLQQVKAALVDIEEFLGEQVHDL